jgi:Flp pilus assembly protein TadB
MNLRTIINRTLILSVFAIAGYLLARSFYYGSLIGIVLAMVAIGAWAMFLYQLNNMQAKRDEDVVEELPGRINN